MYNQQLNSINVKFEIITNDNKFIIVREIKYRCYSTHSKNIQVLINKVEKEIQQLKREYKTDNIKYYDVKYWDYII